MQKAGEGVLLSSVSASVSEVSGGAGQRWRELQEVLAGDGRPERESLEHIVHLQVLLDEQLRPEAMLALVREVMQQSASSLSLAEDRMFAIFNGYRKIQNAFQYFPDKLKALYCPNPYLKLVADCVVRCFADPDLASSAGMIVDRISVEARRAVSFSLLYPSITGCDFEQPESEVVIKNLSQSSQLEFLNLALNSPMLTTLKSRNKQENRSTPKALLEVLKSLMTAAMYSHNGSIDNSHCLTSMEVADRVFLNGSILSGDAIRSLITCFRRQDNNDDLVEFAELVAGGVWAEPAFVSRSNGALQCSLTLTLLESLRRLRKEWEMSGYIIAEQFPAVLMGNIARGVSVYIDSPDSMTRLHGMRTAVEFSRIMALRNQFSEKSEGAKTSRSTAGDGILVFEELDLYEEDSDGQLVLKSKSQTEVSVAELEAKKTPLPRDDDNDSDDSDDSEDLEAFYLDEVDGRRVNSGVDESENIGAKEELTPVHYLRQALALLQFSDSSNPDGTYVNHKSVLTALPRLVSARPADGADLTAPLLRELLRLGNSFNMPHFAELRGVCLTTLVRVYPIRSLDVLVWAIGGDTMAVGVRLEALASMVDGAYHLAGLKRSQKKTEGVTTDFSLDTKNVSDELDNTRSKTVVKRPLRLAALQRENTLESTKNSFGDVALKFFKPIYTILAAQLDDRIINKNCNASEGLEVVLPSQCLISLGSFVRCAINTTPQRNMLESVLTIAYPLVNDVSLALRRAAASALYDCVDTLLMSLTQCRMTSRHHGSHQFGTLNFLMNLSPERLADDNTVANENFNALIPSLKNLITSTIQWASSSLQTEHDTHCKVFQCEIVSKAISFFEQ